MQLTAGEAHRNIATLIFLYRIVLGMERKMDEKIKAVFML